MTKKSGEDVKKSGEGPAEAFLPSRRIDARKLLLAQVAGSIVGGLMAAPSESMGTAEAIASIAVDIAEEILKRVGIEEAR